MSEPLAVIQSPALPQWRPRVAMFLFVVALMSPGIALLILAGDLPQDTRLAVGGLLLFGVPMALMLAVVALMGQRAYRFIKRRVAAGDPAAEVVGLTRYRTGLVLLLVAMLVSWLEPLVSPHFPAIEARRVLIGTLADALVLVGLFVLGGEFWDKFHALFVHDARVVPDSVPWRRADGRTGAGRLCASTSAWPSSSRPSPPGCWCRPLPPPAGAPRRSPA